MNIAEIVQAWQVELGLAERPQLYDGVLGEVFVRLPVEHLHRAVEMLVHRFGVWHLSTVTGQDLGEEIELLYHFWSGQGLTVRVSLPLASPALPTVTDLIPGAEFYEREVAEMLGVTFVGHPNPAPLLLSDDWHGPPPLRRSAEPAATPSQLAAHVTFSAPACPEVAPGSRRIIIPIGPQHPMLKEPLSYLLTAEGERIVNSALRLGYVHRGIERLCQERNYSQNLHLLERICGICSYIHTTVYCQGVEALLGVEVPRRARYLRTLLCELERIHSHLLWLGVLAENIGFTTIFMYAWRDREITLDIMEELTGGRVSHAANVIGGVRMDLDEHQVHAVAKQLAEFTGQVERFRDLIQREQTFRMRTLDVGNLSTAQVYGYCAVGPLARASGVNIDLRRDMPYAAYDELTPRVVTHHEGDVWARTWVRMEEILVSLDLCQQILRDLPDGPLAIEVPRRVPAGEVVSRAEAPRGEVIYYIRSDGSDKPARVKVRTPTLTALITLSDQMRDISIADVPAVIGGMDLCIACGDR